MEDSGEDGSAEAGEKHAEADAEAEAALAPPAEAKEEKEELFSSFAARILLRLTAGCTRPEPAPLEDVQTAPEANAGDAPGEGGADAAAVSRAQ